MKETIRFYAQYTKEVNGKLHDVLAGLADPQVLNRDTGSYFSSVLGILNHIAASDIVWFQRLRSNWPELESLRHELVETDIRAFREKPYGAVEAWWRDRQQLDEIYGSLVEELSEERLAETFSYTNSRGIRRTPAIWQLLLHVFNHQTHHRGQISQILDEAGVENDYSNVIALLDEAE
jgi:uncharacterized damage-inducible protein DinB